MQGLFEDVKSNMPLGEGSFTPLEQGRVPFTPISINPGTKYIQQTAGKSGQMFSPPSVLPGETKYLPGGLQAGEPNLNLTDSFDKVRSLLRDSTKLQSTLETAQSLGTGENLRKTLADFHFADVFNNAATRNAAGDVVRLDPTKINELWQNPEMQASMKKLYNAPTRAAMDQFFTNIVNTQDKLNIGSAYNRLRLVRQGVYIAGSVVMGTLSGRVGATSGIILSTQTLGALLRNPTTARVMVGLAGGGPLNMSEQFAGKLIVRALQGTTIAVVDDKGNKQPAQVGPDGQLLPLR
jgi:hypothetical protein